MLKKPKVKVLYITSGAPCSTQEAFVIQELLKVKEFFQVIILPVIPRSYPQYDDAKELLKDSIVIPLINLRILIGFLVSFINDPYKTLGILGDILKESRSVRVLLRNLCVVPKAVYMSRILKDMGVSHIHAHYASFQTTFALIISKILGIPFSFTAHRYDIDENNMLRKKVLDASFVRTISEEGKGKIVEFTGLHKLVHKIHVIHMGVRIPDFKQEKEALKDPYVIACPANLFEVKGHKYLIEACALLGQKQLNFKCLIIGNGTERSKIKLWIRERGLEGYVFLEGYYPHSKLMEMLETKQIHLVVLPSIVTKEGAKEGIPVALMEAMSFGVPVVSTNTGGIPELLVGDAGIMVREKEPTALAEAIYSVLTDKEIRRRLIRNGYDRVYREFNLDRCSERLIACIQNDLSNTLKEKVGVI